MKTEEFADWLKETKKYKKNVLESRLSNCHRVEEYYSDLDNHFRKDKGKHLFALFTYSKDDERENKPTKHVIPINGNLREGSATLKQAIKLYMNFMNQKSEAK